MGPLTKPMTSAANSGRIERFTSMWRNKKELLDGMVVVGEIDPTMQGAGWKDAIRQWILSARQALLRHRWASHVIESRTHASPVVLDYMNSLIGMFRAGGFSVDLTHHVMHALGSRMWGFTQEVFPTPPPPADPDVRAAMFRQVAAQSFPSPVCLNTVPFAASTTLRTISSCCASDTHMPSGSDSHSFVLPSMSENTKVTTPLGRVIGATLLPDVGQSTTQGARWFACCFAFGDTLV